MSAVEQSPGAPPGDATRAPRDNLIALVWGQGISLFGDYVAIFTLPYFMLALTGNPVDLTLVWWFENLPMLLFGLAAGVYLDRRMRLKLTLIGVDLVRATLFLALAAATSVGAATPIMVFLVAFTGGSMAVVFDSGLQALMPSVLRESQLITANSRLELVRTAMGAAGPLVAGLAVLASAGFGIAFAINGLSFLASAAFLSLMRPIRERDQLQPEPMWESLRSGLRFLLGEPHLRWATLGASATNLVFAPLAAILVLFVASIVVGVDVTADDTDLTAFGGTIGAFFTAMAVVGAVGVAMAPAVSRRLPLGTMYVLGLGLFGLGFVVMSQMSSLAAAVPAGVGLTGVTWMNIALATMRQRLTPSHLLGRVITASRWLAWLPFVFAPIGGILAQRHGLQAVYLHGAAALLVVALALTATAVYRDPVMAVPDEPWAVGPEP
jgi:MFS family permease